MADRCKSWAELLAAGYRQGEHFEIDDKPKAGVNWLIAAPHGGGIEPGTTEIAEAIAGDDFGFYTVKGILEKHNKEILHITSHNFDEPGFLKSAPLHRRVLGVHGRGNKGKHVQVWVGGGRSAVVKRAVELFRLANYSSEVDTHYNGDHPQNICNRGVQPGLQLELPKAFREQFFPSLKRRVDRAQPNDAFRNFVRTVQDVLAGIDVEAMPLPSQSGIANTRAQL